MLIRHWYPAKYKPILLQKARIAYYKKHEDLLQKARIAYYRKHELDANAYYQKHETLLQENYL